EVLRRLYGPVFCSGRPVSVYITSSLVSKSSSIHAAFSLYWGKNSCKNSAYQFEGKQTEARGSLVTVLKVVIEAPPNHSLIIFTASQYAIRSLCYWAGNNAVLGWPCAHGDILKVATDRIHERTAPLEFRCAKSGVGNAAMVAAKLLAK
ncbi:hypothetical protein C8R44DRAFT_530490, partial [Mycena epipterygia]